MLADATEALSSELGCYSFSIFRTGELTMRQTKLKSKKASYLIF